MRRKRFAAPPFLFLGAAFFLHRFGGERERGWDTKEWERERGREVQKIFRFAKLQFYFGTKSDWGERESERERGIERVCVCVCA